MPSLSPRNLVVIDIETTGINPFVHDAVAIGFVPIDDKLPSREIFIAHKEMQWNSFAYENFQRFRNDWSQHAISPSRACEEIEDYVHSLYSGEQVTLVGHNVGFDVAFLRKVAFQGGRDQLGGISHRVIDTHTILYVLALSGVIPFDATTSDGAFHHFGIEIKPVRRHQARADAEATRALFLRLVDQFANHLHPIFRQN